MTLLEAGVTRQADGVVRVPYRDTTGCEWNAKLYSPGGRTWWERRGLGARPFGLERVAQIGFEYVHRNHQRDGRTIWLAEGETDAVALRQHYAEWRGRPVDVIGLPGAGSWRDEWARHVDGYSRAYCFPDGDEAGERMAERVTTSVRWTIPVRLPTGRDARSVIQDDGPNALDEWIMRAEWTAAVWVGMVLCPTLPELERFLAEVEL